jgi:hypothetical protein
MFIVATAMNPSSKCLNSSNALSACSHHDNISGSAVALLDHHQQIDEHGGEYDHEKGSHRSTL